MPTQTPTKENKEDKIITEWLEFLKSEMKRELFTDNIYAHLVLHGGFKFKEDKTDFYNYYFAECDKAHRLYPVIKYKRICHILEHHFDAIEGKNFSDSLFSDWNQYGSYAKTNKDLQFIYMDQMKKTAEFLESFTKNASEKEENKEEA